MNTNMIAKNQERITALLSNVAEASNSKKFHVQNERLQVQCELNLRKILAKYYNGEGLTVEEYNTIDKYLFYSSLSYFANPDGPSYYNLFLQSAFGAGQFDDDELDVIHKISYENSQISRHPIKKIQRKFARLRKMVNEKTR